MATEELKVRSIRADEATFEKFKKLAEDFGNQGTALNALISLYEIENSKVILGDRKAEVDSFQTYLQKMQELFINALEINNSTEDKIRNEFQSQLKAKNITIENLQNMNKELTKKNKELEGEIKNLKDCIQTKVNTLDLDVERFKNIQQEKYIKKIEEMQKKYIDTIAEFKKGKKGEITNGKVGK